MCTIKDSHIIYGSWRNTIWNTPDSISCHFSPFSALLPLTTKKIKILKIEKTPKDTINSDMCTTNDNQIMYGSWDIERGGQIFSSFWAIFCPFTPLTTQNIKILKKIKKLLDILLFYTCVT